MFLAGIVPGPNEPPGDQLNHFLEPLINEMVESWERGISFNHTALHLSGWVVRSAIACVVCDLPAARKAAQMSAARSYFYCSICNCCNLKTLGRTDFHSMYWSLRDKAMLQQQAEEYKNAESAQQQEALFAKFGIRWLPLWKLPYWDPARQLVVDVMHCILEGITAFHVHNVLQLTTVAADTCEALPPAFEHPFSAPVSTDGQPLKENDIKQIKEVHSLLSSSVKDLDAEDGHYQQQIDSHIASLTKRLGTKNIQALKFVATDLHCKPIHDGKVVVRGRVLKVHWINTLIQWVRLFQLGLYWYSHNCIAANKTLVYWSATCQSWNSRSH